MHADRHGVVVRAFPPGARGVEVIDVDSGKAAARARARARRRRFRRHHRRAGRPFAYRLRVDYGGTVEELEDPYRFAMVLGELDVYLLAEGTHYRAL